MVKVASIDCFCLLSVVKSFDVLNIKTIKTFEILE